MKDLPPGQVKVLTNKLMEYKPLTFAEIIGEGKFQDLAGDGVELGKIYKSKNAFFKAKSICKNYTFIYTSGRFKGRLIEEACRAGIAEQAAAGQQFFEFEGQPGFATDDSCPRGKKRRSYQEEEEAEEEAEEEEEEEEEKEEEEKVNYPSTRLTRSKGGAKKQILGVLEHFDNESQLKLHVPGYVEHYKVEYHRVSHNVGAGGQKGQKCRRKGRGGSDDSRSSSNSDDKARERPLMGEDVAACISLTRRRQQMRPMNERGCGCGVEGGHHENCTLKVLEEMKKR
jgi:hypothetical protein